MPPSKNPKPSLRGRSSQLRPPTQILIYASLADHENPNPIRQIVRKLQALSRHSEESVEKSLAMLVLDCCGLEKFGPKIDWQEPEVSLGELLEETCRQGNLKIVSSDLYIINTRSKFHEEFIKRLTEFLKVVFSEDSPFSDPAPFLKTSFLFIKVISQSKLRNIRASAVALASIFLTRKCLYYEQLLDKRNPKKAANVLTIIEEGYLTEIVLPRVQDVDKDIREKAFGVMHESMVLLQSDFCTVKKMEELFSPLLNQHKSKKIVENCIKTLLNISQDTRLNKSASKNFVAYHKSILPLLEEICMIPNKDGCQAIKLLRSLNQIDPEAGFLKPKTIRKAFQVHALQKNKEGVRNLIASFYKSLISFKDERELSQHRQMLTVDVLHLLSSLGSTKLMKMIAEQFFRFHCGVFSFEEMLVLLLTGYHTRQGKEIQLQCSEIEVLLQMICEFNKYLRKQYMYDEEIKVPDWVQSQQEIYNKYVLSHSKEIFFQKIPEQPTQAALYLELYTLIYMPIGGTLQSYGDFVMEQVLSIMKQEKFIVMGKQRIQPMQQIIRQCAAVGSNFMANMDVGSCVRFLRSILQAFQIEKIGRKNSKLDDIDILKIVAIISKISPSNMHAIYPADDLLLAPFLQEELFRRMLDHFSDTSSRNVKLEIITYIYCAHQLLFQNLFQSPNQQRYRAYISFRNVTFEFLLEGVLDMADSQHEVEIFDEKAMTRVAAFNTVCNILKYTTSSKIAQIPVIYYQPSERNLQILLDFVYTSFNSLIPRRGADESTILTIMMQNISTSIDSLPSTSIEAREQILSNLFDMFQTCYRMVCKTSNHLIAKFLCRLLLLNQQIKNGEDVSVTAVNLHRAFDIEGKVDRLLVCLAGFEVQDQNKNRFVFWRLFDSVMSELNNMLDPQNVKEKEAILSRMIDTYNSYRKGHVIAQKSLANRLMLYIADSIDKSLSSRKFELLSTVQATLKKTNRRFTKQMLQRLNIFYGAKVDILSNEGVINLKDIQDKRKKSEWSDLSEGERQIIQLKLYLKKISKAARDKRKIEEKEHDESSSSSGEEEEEEEKQEHRETKTGKKMQQEEAQDEEDETELKGREKKKGKGRKGQKKEEERKQTKGKNENQPNRRSLSRLRAR